MNAFLSLWSAVKRLAESFNGLADEVDNVREDLKDRRLAYSASTEPPKKVEALPEPASNGRRKAVTS